MAEPAGERKSVSETASHLIENVQANIPDLLKESPQWVLWKWEQRGAERKKPPFSPDGKRASIIDPATWSSYEQVTKAFSHSQNLYNGLGYVLTTGIVVIDLDHCIKWVSGERRIIKKARQIYDLAGSYSEISPSGSGLHIFLKGQIPQAGKRTKGIEIYQSQRYITITGDKAGEAQNIREDQRAIDRIYSLVSPPQAQQKKPEQKIYIHTATDSQVLEKASKAENGAKFQRLYRGDITNYPSKSEADLALIAMLAYWTNRNPNQIESLFKSSGLYTPETAKKWEEKHSKGYTYGQITILKALKTAEQY